MTVLSLIADALASKITATQPGHCVRVDGLTVDEAYALRESLQECLGHQMSVGAVEVRVLAEEVGPGKSTIEEAVAIRNDKLAVFILLVPPTLANEASSLDNSFQRIPYGQLLESVGDELVRRVQSVRPDFSASQFRSIALGRVSVESWLDFLVTVYESPERSIGPELWRIGVLPDEGSAEEIEDRLPKNSAFIRAVVDPQRATQGIRERLRASGLRPGAQMEAVVRVAERNPDAQNNAREWARVLHEVLDVPFKEMEFAKEELSSDLQSFRVLPFVGANGTVPKSAGLVLTDDGTLECQIAEGNEATLQVKWRTEPSKTDRVAKWLIELLPPDDLRDSSESASLLDMTVAGSRRQATLKLDVTADDLSAGSLFVVRVSPLDEFSQGLPLPTDAQPESQAFEIVLLNESLVDSPRPTQAGSVADARLRAVVSGAQSIEEGRPTWYREQQQFGLTFGGFRGARVPVCDLVVTMQRRTLAEPDIVSYVTRSPYGAVIDSTDFEEIRTPLPPALARKREAVAEALKAAGLRDVPEVFAWDTESRALVAEYLATYRRALDASTGDQLVALQNLDTVAVSIGTGESVREATVVLPLNPLRLAWIAAFDELTTQWARELIERTTKAAERRELVSLEGLSRIAPTNLPFAVSSSSFAMHVYFDELVFGVGLLLPLGQDAPEVLAAEVSAVLGIERESMLLRADATSVADRLGEYAKAHPDPKAIRIAALNPADGVVLASSLERFIATVTPERDLRFDVIAYGSVDRYANPLRALTTLQQRADNEHAGTSQNPLFPRIGLGVRPMERLAEDAEEFHVAIVDGIGELSISPAPSSAVARFASMADLLTPQVDTPVDRNAGTSWFVSPVLTPRGAGTLASALVDCHRSQQAAVGSSLGLGGAPAVLVEVRPDTIDNIRVAHERSDWVITLDRHIGLDFFETSRWDPSSRRYILDYSPDFIAGMSHKLTVTTAHRAEVTGVLKRAIEEFGLDSLESSATQVLGDLMSVSGRLVLRLQSSEGFARESVSLAALIAHLRQRGELDGVVLVPVDSHHEIFGRSAPGNESGRRCDLLIVRLSSRKLSIQCVEVKSRQHAALPLSLADDIVDQLVNTRALLEERFFATDPPRVDAPLQRALLAGLLHYYAERSVTSGILDHEKVADVHRNIDRIVEGGLEPEISLRGYVISLNGAEGIPAHHRGVPISVLTANDLGAAGFTVRTGVDLSTGDASERGDDHGASDAPETSPALPPVAPVDGDARPGDGDQPVVPSEDAERGTTLAASADRKHNESSDTASTTGEPSTVQEFRTDDQGRPVATPGPVILEQSLEVNLGHDGSGGEVTWAPSTKGSPHAFIIGIPGQGKSVTTRRIIRELAAQGLPSLVFDFHGDMANDPPAAAEVLDASQGLPITPFDQVSTSQRDVNEAAWDLAEVIQFVAQLGDIQRSNVYKALQEVYAAAAELSSVPNLNQLAQALEKIEEGSRARNARERLIPLIDFGLFAEGSASRFDPRKNGMVIDLSGIRLEQVQVAGSSFLLRSVYKDMFSWPQDGTLKLAIVLDEAHRLAGDVTLPKLMKEGRKYGVAVIVASQGLGDFNADVLGNAGTKIVFRTNQPESKAVARYLRGRQGQDLALEIERLDVGNAYVSTADLPQARKTRMLD